MRVLILTCNTGGGHNAVAAALRDSLQRCGASCDVMDGLGFISKKASKFVSKWHTRFYRRYPRLYKAGYMSAEGDKEMDRRDGPVYRTWPAVPAVWAARCKAAATMPLSVST